MTTFHTELVASNPAPHSRHPARSLVTIAMVVLVLAGSLLLAATPANAQVDDQSGDRQTSDNLNLRSGPSLEDDVLVVMPAGSTVAITGEVENGFYPVTYQDLAGFAHGDYLTDAAEAPAESPVDSGSTSNDMVQIIYDAAAMYGQSGDDMLRVAQCESGLNPSAVNSSSNASGLFQFLPSTWATTPYASQDIFDPVANAEAASWMWSEGRRNEWVCQ